MKNQNYGEYIFPGPDCPGLRRYVVEYLTSDWDAGHHLIAPADYKEKRLNGDEKQDGPGWKLPFDGTGRWTKGEENSNGFVHGVKESDGIYQYEYRYDAGNGDKKWMEECDRNYLARLYLSQNTTQLTTQEQQDLKENANRAK